MKNFIARTSALGALVLLGVAGASLSPAQASTHAMPAGASAINTASSTNATGYYKSTLNDDVYAVTGYGTASASIKKLTFAQWAAAGAPKPTAIRPTFVKYSWSPDIYAQISFGTTHSTDIAQHLNFTQWAQAGYPAPKTATWIQGTVVYRLSSNSAEIFAKLGETYHKYSFAEWLAAGQPSPTQYSDLVVRLAWNPNVAVLKGGFGGTSSLYTFALWQKAGYPTPITYTRVPNDSFVRTCGSNDIYYFGPTWQGKLTFAQWAAAGAPTPSVQGDCAEAKAAQPVWQYANCVDVWNTQGRALRATDPGFNAKLDGDRDGVACEKDPR